MTGAKTIIIWSVALIVGTLAEIDSDWVNDSSNYTRICALLPQPATILSPGSCTEWIKCAVKEESADSEQGSCLVGLYYDKDDGKCKPSEKVSCPYERKSKRPCQNVADGTFLENPENCTSYIFCKNGEELYDYCPGDLVFHPQKAECVYKQDYNCPQSQSLKPKPHPICNSVKDDLAFADELSCKTFHRCHKGVLQTQECRKGYAFDHLKGHCEPAQNATCIATALQAEPALTVCGTAESPKDGFFPDEKSCSGYYICKKVEGGIDRDPVFARCPNGSFFDAKKLSCRDRLNVQCHANRCEGMGNKYVNIAGDCSSYARCQDNVITSTGKCPDKYFFDEKTQGCTPQKVHYAACSAKKI